MSAHDVQHRSRRVVPLLELGSSTVHEASGSLGHRGAMDSGIHRGFTQARVCGPAFTVRCHPADNLGIHQAVFAAHSGDVLVVDGGGVLVGYWGEMLTALAQSRGLAGLVIDGGVRDIDEIERRRFPVFARGISMLGTAKATAGILNGLIVCGGVPVNPGDWVLGDGDGVVSIAGKAIDEVIESAQNRKAREREMLGQIEKGIGADEWQQFLRKPRKAGTK